MSNLLTPFSADGRALVGAGALINLQVQLQQPDQAAGWDDQALDGRVFVLIIVSALGVELLGVTGVAISDSTGRYILFVLTGTMTASLLGAQAGSADHTYTVSEITSAGRIDIISEAFSVRRNVPANASFAPPPSGGPTGQGARFVVQQSSGGSRILVQYQGAPGRSAKQVAADAGAIPQTATDADFAAWAMAGVVGVALEAEVTRAKAAETTLADDAAAGVIALNGRVSTETGRATTAEGTLAQALADETTRAKAAETTLADDAAAGVIALNGRVSTETGRATTAEGTLAQALADETTRAKAAETTLADDAAAGVVALNTRVTVETTRATIAEGVEAQTRSDQVGDIRAAAYAQIVDGARYQAACVFDPATSAYKLLSYSKATGGAVELVDGLVQVCAITADDQVVFVFSGALSAWDRHVVPAAGGAVRPWISTGDRYHVGANQTAGLGCTDPVHQSFTALLAARYPTRNYVNDGFPAQNSERIAARCGALPVTIAVAGNQIPASGPVACAVPNILLLDQYLEPTISRPGTLGGIYGTLTITATSSTTGSYSFTRAVAGAAVTVPNPAPFVIDPQGWTSRTMVVELGRNDVGSPSDPAPEGVLNNLDAIVGTVPPYIKKLLILGITAKSDGSENPGSTSRNAIDALNASMAAAYGGNDRFLDLQAYFVTSGLSEAEAADPTFHRTAADTTAVGNGLVPPSLLAADLVSWNARAHALVANQIDGREQHLGY